MSNASAQAVAVAPPAFLERGGQVMTTPAYPYSVHATRPLRSSPLAGPALSGNAIPSSGSKTSAISLDVRPYSRSTPSSITSHTGSLSASTSSFSSHAHRAPAALAGPSKSTSSIPTLNLDSRPHSSLSSAAGSLSASTSSFSSYADSASRPLTIQAKSTSTIPTLNLFRRPTKDDPSPPPPTQPPFGHNRRSTSFTHRAASPPPHIPKAYSPHAPRPSTSPGPSVSRDPNDNWVSSSPFGPASTPRFSRQSMSRKPVVMPLSAREYRRQKCISMTSNVATPVASYSPADGMANDSDRVNRLPYIIVSDSESPRDPLHPAAQSGNRSSRRVSSPSIPCTAVSQAPIPSGSPEPQLSPKSSSSTFFSFASENEAESTVITVVDPGVAPRRRRSTPNPTQRHSRLSLVDAVNRLSAASGDTEFFDMEENAGVRQRQISVTEDDGVLRRVSSRRRTVDVPFREVAMADTVAEEPTAPHWQHPRMVRIAEASEVSSDKSPSVLGSKFSESSHDCQQKDGPESGTSGIMFPDQAASHSTTDLKSQGTSSPELEARPRRKLTKSRLQSEKAPPARLGSLPWIPGASSFKSSVKQNTPTTSTSNVTLSENVPKSLEPGGSGKENKRWTRRLTFQFIPSPSFHRRPKSTPGVTPSLEQVPPIPPMRNGTRQMSYRAESGFITGNTLSSFNVTQGSASTITLVPPPPIMSSSSVSSSAANSTSSLTGSCITTASQDTSASSIAAPSPVAVSRLEQRYHMVPSNLKESIVVQSGGDTDSDESEVQQENSREEATTPPPAVASHNHELQETCSLSSVSSYVSFPSISAPGSIPTATDATNVMCSLCSRPEAVPNTHASVKHHTQSSDPDYLHPMWTVPMVTITAASQTALPHINDLSITHEPPVRPTVIPASPPAPTLKIPSTRPRTTRLKRPRPQTAPSSTRPPIPLTRSAKSPQQKVGMSSSGFKSFLRSLVGRAG